MRVTFARLFVVLPVLVLSACAQTSVRSQADTSAELRRQIEAVNREMEAAFNRGDLLAVARFYADDAVMMGPRGERVRGRAALDAYWQGVTNPRRWRLDVFDVGGSLTEAYQLGRSTLTTGTDGRERDSVTDFIVLWKRDAEGRWRIAVDMWPGGGS